MCVKIVGMNNPRHISELDNKEFAECDTSTRFTSNECQQEVFYSLKSQLIKIEGEQNQTKWNWLVEIRETQRTTKKCLQWHDTNSTN